MGANYGKPNTFGTDFPAFNDNERFPAFPPNAKLFPSLGNPRLNSLFNNGGGSGTSSRTFRQSDSVPQPETGSRWHRPSPMMDDY
jgi:hypothetical protein